MVFNCWLAHALHARCSCRAVAQMRRFTTTLLQKMKHFWECSRQQRRLSGLTSSVWHLDSAEIVCGGRSPPLCKTPTRARSSDRPVQWYSCVRSQAGLGAKRSGTWNLQEIYAASSASQSVASARSQDTCDGGKECSILSQERMKQRCLALGHAEQGHARLRVLLRMMVR